MSERWDHNIHYHDILLAALPVRCRRALDIGRGEGTFARRLAERADVVEALDSSAEAIGRARQLSQEPHLFFRQADFMEAEFEAEYDYVSAIAALHHMPFGEALEKMKGLVRPGGVLAVLGLFEERTKFDLAASLVAVPINRHLLRTRGEGDGYSPLTAEPTMNMQEIRSAARQLLPGARLRRHLLWRYSLLWTRPS